MRSSIDSSLSDFGKSQSHDAHPEGQRCQKTKVFNQCVLPDMTYAAEMWTLTAGSIHKLKVAQRAIERAVLGVSLKDKIRNEVIQQRIKAVIIAQRISNLKCQRAGNVWGKRILEWRPRLCLGQHRVGRPPASRGDYLRKIAGEYWMRRAEDCGVSGERPTSSTALI